MTRYAILAAAVILSSARPADAMASQPLGMTHMQMSVRHPLHAKRAPSVRAY